MSYFKNFPLIQYANNLVKNILARPAIDDKLKDYRSAFYVYETKNEESLQDIAYNYYDDAKLDWILNLTNGVIDPYYDKYKTYNQMISFITKKYGSIAAAQQEVLEYRTNWPSDFSTLTVAGYAALSDGQKKYWDAIVSDQNAVVGYERKKVDVSSSTNKIESISLTSAVSTALTVGERIIRDDDSSSVAFVSWANTSAFNIKHVTGDFSSNSTYTATGQTSGITVTANGDSHSVLKTVIPTDELTYYTQVTAYQDEFEKNEAKKNIDVLQKSYANKLQSDLKEVLN
jgi:hypothetical protein